jgi:hypothetical protein
MYDFRDDPNVRDSSVREYDTPMQWIAVVMILLVCGALVTAAFWPSGETQTAMNTPPASTERATPIPVLPPQ